MRKVLCLCTLFLGLHPFADAQTYSTNFRNSESPLSDGGKWTNGGTNGLDWTNVQVIGGIACGTQSGTGQGPKMYDDSYAILSGFAPDQTALGVVRYENPSASCHQEVELLLRWTSLPHKATGYECLFRCLNASESYIEIVRWNGSLGDWTYLARFHSNLAGINDGDTLKAEITGTVISVYVNNMLKLQAIDSTYTTGNPGIGFFLSKCPGTISDFGFSSFSVVGR
jgi:hypothetical protein